MDGRPNQINKAPFSNSFGAVWIRPLKSGFVCFGEFDSPSNAKSFSLAHYFVDGHCIRLLKTGQRASKVERTQRLLQIRIIS